MTREDDAWFNADETANEMEEQAGIAEPAQTVSSFLFSIILPCLVVGVLLIVTLWWLIDRFHLLG
ncbi:MULTISPECIES: hypothetical protein [Asaia]|uniref:Uncharacterized protein n=2 Tax=Asaia TaxID=91914 RepID=A0ABQ1LCW7_9PROT|nr:hypothetical protein [Asaia spathodeae]GBR08380.1 hypothetical protein AA0323_2106 [Asaia siamensis NRIC 0323]GBR13702.1 hypothetical protein AA105894_0891 [Asaia spathodeae NBRC 105894]GGC22920.1 hypothetical protein GCM10007207_05230 [Asaia siamensis]